MESQDRELGFLRGPQYDDDNENGNDYEEVKEDNDDKEDNVGQDDLTPTTEAVTANPEEVLAPTDTHTHHQAPRALAAQVARRRESARLQAQRSSPSEPDSFAQRPGHPVAEQDVGSETSGRLSLKTLTNIP